jgi:hypothetical protein
LQRWLDSLRRRIARLGAAPHRGDEEHLRRDPRTSGGRAGDAAPLAPGGQPRSGPESTSDPPACPGPRPGDGQPPEVAQVLM